MRAVTAASYVLWCVVAAAAHAPVTSDRRQPSPAPQFDATINALAYILAKANIAQELVKLFPPDPTPAATSEPTHSEKKWTPRKQPENIEVPSTWKHNENSRTGQHENSSEKYHENNEKLQVNMNLCQLYTCITKSKDLNRKHDENNGNKHKEYNKKLEENKNEANKSNENTDLKYSDSRGNSHEKHNEDKPRDEKYKNNNNHREIDEQKHQENNKSQKKNKKYLENSNNKYQDSSAYEELSKLLDKHNLPEDLVSLLNHLNYNKQTDSKHNHIVVVKHKNKGKNKDLHLHNKIKENLNALTEDLSAEIINLHGSDVTDDVTSSIISEEVIALPIPPEASTKKQFEKVIDLSTKQDLSEDKNVMDLPSKTSVKSQEVLDLPAILQNFNKIINEKPSSIHSIETGPIVSKLVSFEDEFTADVDFIETNDVTKIGSLETRSKEMKVNELDPLENKFANDVGFKELTDVTNKGQIEAETPPEDEFSNEDSYLVDSSSESSESLEDFLINNEIYDTDEKPLEVVHKTDIIDSIKSVPVKSNIVFEPEFHQIVNFQDQILTPLSDDFYDVVQSQNDVMTSRNDLVTSRNDVVKSRNDLLSTSRNAVVPVEREFKEKIETLAELVKMPVAIVQEAVDDNYDHVREADHGLDGPDPKRDHEAGHGPSGHDREVGYAPDVHDQNVDHGPDSHDRKTNHGPDGHDRKVDHHLELKTNLPLAYDNKDDHIINLNLKEPRDHNDHDRDLALDLDLKTIPVAIAQEPIASSDYGHEIDHLMNPNPELNMSLVHDHLNYHDHELLDRDHNQLNHNISSQELPLAYEVAEDHNNNHDLNHKNDHDHKIDHLSEDDKSNHGSRHKIDLLPLDSNLPLANKVLTNAPKNYLPHRKHHDHKIDHIIDDHTNHLPVAIQRDGSYEGESLLSLNNIDKNVYDINDIISDKKYDDVKDDVHQRQVKLHHHHENDRHNLEHNRHNHSDDKIINDKLIIDTSQKHIGEIMKPEFTDDTRHTKHIHKDLHKFDDTNYSNIAFVDDNKPTTQPNNDILTDTSHLQHRNHKDDIDSNYEDDDDVIDKALTVQQIDNGVHDVHNHHTSSSYIDVYNSSHDVHSSSHKGPSSSYEVPSSSQYDVLSSSHDVHSSSHTESSSSHEVPSSSHEVPSSSHRVPSLSHEVLSSSHDVHGASHKVPSPSHEVTSSSHEVPSSSHRVHSWSHDVHSSSYKVPSSSHDVLSSSHEDPSLSHKGSSSSHEVPSTLHEVTSSPHDIHSSSHDVPSSSHEIPFSSHDLHSSTLDIPSLSHDLHSSSLDTPSSSHDHVLISLLDILPLLSIDAEVPISSNFEQNHNPSSQDDVIDPISSHEVQIPVLTHKEEAIPLLDILSSLSNDAGIPISSHDVHSSSLDLPSSSNDHSPISLFDLLSISSHDTPSLSHDVSSSSYGVHSSSHDMPSSSHDHVPVSLLDLLSSPDTSSSLHDVHSSSHSAYSPLVPVSSHEYKASVSSHSVVPSHSSSSKLDEVQQQKYYQLSFVFNK